MGILVLGDDRGVVDTLYPITLMPLPLLIGIRKDEGVQGRGVVTSGSGLVQWVQGALLSAQGLRRPQ